MLHTNGKFVVFFIFLVVTQPLVLFARTEIETTAHPKLMKMTPTAAQGACLSSKPPTNLNDLFKRNNIQISTGIVPDDRKLVSEFKPFTNMSDDRVIAVAKILAAYEGIGSGAMDGLKNGNKINIIFDDGAKECGNSRRIKLEACEEKQAEFNKSKDQVCSKKIPLPDAQIQLCPGKQNQAGLEGESEHGGVDNLALIAHEIAHEVGACQDRKRYNAYNTYMDGQKCEMTGYMKKNREEEFAEVMTAYLTMPQAFKDQGKACTAAFNFMKTLFGESSELNLNLSGREMCHLRQASYVPGLTASARRVRVDGLTPKSANYPLPKLPGSKSRPATEIDSGRGAL